MCMVDLGLKIELGAGVAAAQDYYRQVQGHEQKDAA
jgi:alanine-glyoxylate transaminase / serine-glyoxylate transaminase / serine-pyruvate transaminase